MNKRKGRNELAGKTILLVHAMNEGKYFIVKKMKQMGLRVVCLHREQVPALEKYVDYWITADIGNSKECIEATKSFFVKNPSIHLDGVITFWDESVLLTSKIADAFHLIGIPYQIANTIKNKYLFRDFCHNNGIPAPRHHILQSKKDIPEVEKHLSYPLVIKPVYGATSAYVVKVFNRQDLEETYDYIKNNIKSFWLASEWENLEVFVEEYIDGDEVDIDILLQNGKIKFSSVSDNYNKGREKFFIDSGQAIPSSLPKDQQDALLAVAEEILEKSGIQNACIHFEGKYAKKGAYPIEVNLRMGGDYIYSQLKNVWNVDFVEYGVKIALGVYFKIEKPELPYRYIIGWDLQPNASGMLAALDVSPELRKKPYLHGMTLFKEVGDAILRPPEGYESLGWLTVSGDNLLDAKDNLEEALSLIHYNVVEFNEESSLGKTARVSPLSAAILKKNRLLEAEKIERVRRVSLKSQRQLKIGIAGNKVHGTGKSKNGHQPITTRIQEILSERGYKTAVFDFNTLGRTFSELRHSDVDLILNATDGIQSDTRLQPQAAALLEALRIPYTGTNSTNLAFCRDKIRLKKLFSYHDLPTPAWDYLYKVTDSVSEQLRYPLFVKPGNADNAFGITNASVVRNKKELEKQVKYIIGHLGLTALVEEYLGGDEYEVSIIGNDEGNVQVLPLTQSIFTRMPEGYWHIYADGMKQHPARAYKKIIRRNPVGKTDEKLHTLITEIALDAYNVAECRDYGQVEVRLDKEGNPYVLEVDPNPSLDPNGTFIQAARVVEKEYGNVLEEIIAAAVKRYQKKQSWLVE